MSFIRNSIAESFVTVWSGKDKRSYSAILHMAEKWYAKNKDVKNAAALEQTLRGSSKS